MDEQLVKVSHLDKIIKNKDEIIDSLQQEKQKLSQQLEDIARYNNI